MKNLFPGAKHAQLQKTTVIRGVAYTTLMRIEFYKYRIQYLGLACSDVTVRKFVFLKFVCLYLIPLFSLLYLTFSEQRGRMADTENLQSCTLLPPNIKVFDVKRSALQENESVGGFKQNSVTF